MSEDLFREAGALGVYSYYYQNNRDDFSKVKIRSPMRSPNRRSPRRLMAAYLSDIDTTRSTTPLSGRGLAAPHTPTPQSRYESVDGLPSLAGASSVHHHHQSPARQPQLQHANDDVGGRHIDSPRKQPAFEGPPLPVAKHYKPGVLEVLQRVIKTLVGKDKLAKVVYYLFKLLVIYSLRIRSKPAYSEEHLEPLRLSPSKRSVVRQLATNPKLLLIFTLQQIPPRFQGTITGLSLFRQLLRFGSVPFGIRGLAKCLNDSLLMLQSGKLSPHEKWVQLVEYWMNWPRVSQIADVYYSIWDELGLLFKVGLLKKEQLPWLYSLADRQELVGWYYTILLGLRSNFDKYSAVSQQIKTLTVNYQVKQRAVALVGGTSQSPETVQAFKEQVAELCSQRRKIVVNILRLTCDLAYDSTYIFHKSIPQPALQGLGLMSGLLGFLNVCTAEREKLIEEQHIN